MHRELRRIRGSATSGAPDVFASATRWAAALAIVAALAAGAATARAADRPPPPLRFAGLAWDAARAEVAHGLTARGFSQVDAGNAGVQEDLGTWRGQAFGSRVRAVPEFDGAGRLISMTLRFEPDDPRGALGRYTLLVERLRREFGPWTHQIAPGRPVRQEHFGRYGTTRTYGERTAATMWTRDDGAAAAAQLDGDQVVWLRYESPRWEAAQARDGAEH